MQNVPKIVRERLKAAMPAVAHPDANVLSAFVERSLPERERGLVIEHLARCGECRDVVALALPEPEAMQTVFVPAPSRWLTWPVLRWGFVTAGIVAIAALGVVQMQRRQAFTETRHVARVEAPASQVETRSAAASPTAVPAEDKEKSLAAAPSSANAISAGKTSQEHVKDKLIARVRTPQASAPKEEAGVPFGGVASGASRGARHTQYPHGPRMPAQWNQNNQVQAFVQGAPVGAPLPQAAGIAANRKVPSASETVEVQTSSFAVPSDREAQKRSQDLRLQAQLNRSQQESAALGGAVGKAKAPVTVEAANVAPQTADAAAQQRVSTAVVNAEVNGRNVSQLAIPALAPMPQWSINSTGSLQRSFDQGKTWQDVDVNVNAGFGQSHDYTTSVQLLAAAPPKEARTAKKALKQPASTFVLRAVAANGPEVWVGYSQGLLLHSLDVGAHWTYVWPSAGGVNLTGDIVALEFADAQHGKVTTSTGEIWITSNDGQTWQKR